MNEYMLGANSLESRFAEGVPVDRNLNKSQQCALIAKLTGSILGFIRKSLANKSDLVRLI